VAANLRLTEVRLKIAKRRDIRFLNAIKNCQLLFGGLPWTA
jgi:hypothetical protein